MRKRIAVLLAGALIGMTGCGGVKVVSPEAGSSSQKAEFEKIKTPEDEKVVLNIVDWSDSTKDAREKLNEQFMKDHPNVTVNYTTLTQAQFNETMLSGIRAGDAPDLFPLPSTVTFSTAVSEGWFLPMNLYLEEDFFAQIQPEFLCENVTMKGEDVYLLPEAVDIPSALLFYNRALLEEVGAEIDPEKVTWEEFRQVCEQVTENGDGKYYGMVASGAQKNRMDIEFRAFSEVGGAKLGPAGQVFLQEEQTTFADSEVVQAFDLYQELYEKGCFHPDTASLTAPEARKLFGEGKAAFLVQGAWCIPVWEKDNPDLDFGVMKVPVNEKLPDGKLLRPFTKGWMGISANSKHPDVAAEYLKYLYSYEYQKKLMAQGGFVSVRGDLGEKDIENEHMRRYYQYAMEQSIAVPNPVAENGNIELVYSMIQPVVPDFGDIASSIFSGKEIYKKELKNYASQMQENLERSVETVKKQKDISLSDFNYKDGR